MAKWWRQRQNSQAVKCTTFQADCAQGGPAPLPSVVSGGSNHAELQAYHLMQERLNFKYPRARKLLLVLWAMSHLRHSTKGFIDTEALYSRFACLAKCLSPLLYAVDQMPPCLHGSPCLALHIVVSAVSHFGLWQHAQCKS